MDTSIETDTDDVITFKVLIVGEPGVGKTSLAQRYVSNTFSTAYKSTIGVDFANKKVRWDDNTVINLHLWDLAGQDRLNAQVRTYYKDSAGAICICDVTREETKKQVVAWKNVIDEKSTNAEGDRNYPPCILIVNKMDLYDKVDSLKSMLFPPPAMVSGSEKKETLQTSDIEISNSNNSGSREEVTSNSNNALSEKLEELGDGVDFYGEPEMEEVILSVEQVCDKMKSPVEELASQLGFVAGVPVSVKDNIGIDDAMTCLIHTMMRRRDKDIHEGVKDKDDGIIRLHTDPDDVYIGSPGNQSYCSGRC